MTAHRLSLAGIRSPRALVFRTVGAAPGLAGGAAALMVVQQVAEFTVPVLIGVAIDEGIAASDLGNVVWWAAMLVLNFLVLVFAYQYGSRLGLRAVESVQHSLRTALTARLIAPTGIAGHRPVGEMLAIAGSDVTRLSQAVLIVIFPAAEFAALAYAGVALTLIWWPLGLAVFGSGIVFVLTMEVIGRPFRERTEREQEHIGDVGAVTADLLMGTRTLRGFGAAAWAIDQHAAANISALAATKRARAAEQRFIALSRSMSAVLVVAIAVTAGFLALNGAITVGQLVIVVGLVQLVIGPLEALAINLATVWLAALASAKRVLALFAEDEDRPEPLGTQHAPRSHEDPPVLEVHAFGQRIRVSGGQIVGVAAPAAPANALVAQLRRCGQQEAGLMWLNGDDSSALVARELAARLLVATQRVAGAALPAVPTQLREAAQAVDPALSGGELQREALAHAYASASPALVLHDPTSAVDPATEQLIAERLRSAVRGRAVLLITTSPALLAVTDTVVACGTAGYTRGRHHDLLADPGYRELLG